MDDIHKRVIAIEAHKMRHYELGTDKARKEMREFEEAHPYPGDCSCPCGMQCWLAIAALVLCLWACAAIQNLPIARGL